VTSSVAVFEAAAWVKSMYMTKSWLKLVSGNQRNFLNYINLHLMPHQQQTVHVIRLCTEWAL